MPRLVAIGPDGTPYEALGCKYLKSRTPLRGSESPSEAPEGAIYRPLVGAAIGAGIAVQAANLKPQSVALGAMVGVLIALLTAR